QGDIEVLERTQRRSTCPCLRGSSAEGIHDQADRNMDLLLHLACKVVRDRRNPVRRLWGNHFPASLRNIRVMVSRVSRNSEETNLWVIGGLDFLLPIADKAKAYLHVGLASTQPNIADQHILKFNCLVTFDRQGVRTSRGWRLNFQLPLPVGSCHAGCVLTSNFHLHFVSRIRPAPNGICLASLQHHVVAEDRADEGERLDRRS